MNYWKLGCNWGHGMPDFYSLLKEKRIVILGDYPMAKGDWVLICQGYDAVALAKIGSVPVLSTARADLQADFARLQITYGETNSVADAAEFYELTESERFQYQLQQGICRINNPEIRGTIERMLNACKKNKNPIPEFRQEGSMFVATLKKRSLARAKTTTLKTQT